MRRARVVADESGGLIKTLQKLSDTAWHNNGWLARIYPPCALIRIASDAYGDFDGPQSLDEVSVFFQRPDAHGLSCACMHEHPARAVLPRREAFLFWRQIKSQHGRQRAPVLITVCGGGRPAQRVRQQETGFDAWEAHALFCA